MGYSSASQILLTAGQNKAKQISAGHKCSSPSTVETSWPEGGGQIPKHSLAQILKHFYTTAGHPHITTSKAPSSSMARRVFSKIFIVAASEKKTLKRPLKYSGGQFGQPEQALTGHNFWARRAIFGPRAAVWEALGYSLPVRKKLRLWIKLDLLKKN